MRGSELVEARAIVVDRLLNARESSTGLNRAIENIVGMKSQFNGKEVSSYLETYRAKMVMRDIPEERRLGNFDRVVARASTPRCLRYRQFVAIGKTSS